MTSRDHFPKRNNAADLALLLEHVVGMFGMVKLQREPGESERTYLARIDRTIAPWCTFSAAETGFDAEAVPRLSVFHEVGGRWRADFPRIALCAIDTK